MFGTWVTVGQHTDLDGNTSWTLADALGRTFSMTAPDGSTAWSEFDSRGLLADATNVDSITTAFTYDGLGRLIEETRDGLSTSPSFVYDAAGRALSVTDRDGVTTDTVYARSGHPLAVYRERASAADWTLASYTYDDDGLLASAVSLGVETTLGYDSLRRVEAVCEAPSGSGCERETTLSYDLADRVTDTEISGGGSTVTTTHEYDDLGNVTRVIHPDATDATWTYYRSGQVATATDEGGLTTEWGYDDLGRLLIEDRPRQLPRTWSYTNGVSTPDGLYGTQVDRDEPDGGLFSVQTDFAGRSVYAENPYGDSETWSYVGSQLRHRESASGGTALAHQTWGYDAAGRMDVRFGPVDPTTYAATPSPDPASGDYAFGYTYSDAGRLLSREGPNDLTTWDWQDGVKVSEVVSGVSTTDFDYATDVPRLTAKAIGSGTTWRTTDYVYDALGRLAEAEIDDGGEVVTQTWSNRDVYGRPRAQSRAINGAIESSSTLATDLRGRITDVSLFTPTRTGQAAYEYTANGGEAPVVGEAHQGCRPVRERSGPPEGMKGQTRPTFATSL